MQFKVVLSHLLEYLLLGIELLIRLPFIALHTHSVTWGTSLRRLHQLYLRCLDYHVLCVSLVKYICS